MGSMKDRFAALQVAVGERDFDKLRGFIAEDFFIVEPPGLPYSGTFVGPEGFVEVVRRIRELFEVDVVSAEINEAENNTLVCEFVFGFKSLRTGERVEMPAVDIFRFNAEGKLARGAAYYLDPHKVGAIA